MRDKAKSRFAVCTDNQGYPASLEVGKLYVVVPDAAAATHGYICVIDESGEAYGYSAERFFMPDVPAGARDRPERSQARRAPYPDVAADGRLAPKTERLARRACLSPSTLCPSTHTLPPCNVLN
jgi:hypothetical protein